MPHIRTAGIISTHVPTRGTTPIALIQSILLLFQSTFPRGERRFRQINEVYQFYFNPRSHEGNDGKRNQENYEIVYFNPRSHEGNDADTAECKTADNDFNPRSHEGNDVIEQSYNEDSQISIHVPTRGTTAIFPNFRENIFLNTVNLYISFSFSCYTTIISLLFIHFCALFMVRIPIYFYVRFIFAHKSHNKNTVRRNSSIDPYMFYFGFILIPQIVKSQTIYFFIYNIR